MPDIFDINPYASAVYFAAVLLCSMIFMHPALVAVNVVLSFAVCMVIAGKETVANLKYTIAFALVIAFVNPLFSTQGETVLFTYFGRPYTLQALVYGFIMAGLLISCINWFSCMGRVITTDKFMYIMGGRMPNLCTVLTMVISLVPFFQNKLAEISRVQNTVLKNTEKTKGAFRALNAATSYAFEHAINLSVAMKNRGFGSGKPTRFANYRIKKYDIIFLIVTAVLFSVTMWGVFAAATGAQIIPQIVLPPVSGKETAGSICYILMLLLPCSMYIIKELQWQYLKSKI